MAARPRLHHRRRLHQRRLTLHPRHQCRRRALQDLSSMSSNGCLHCSLRTRRQSVLKHNTLRNGVSGMLYSLVGHGRPHRGAYRRGKCRGAYHHHGAYLHRGAYDHHGDMVVSIMELTVIVERTAMDT